jgi:rhodanese-related sulfurtransferase
MENYKMNIVKMISLSTLIGGLALSTTLYAGNNISPGLTSIDVVHNGKSVTISRSDDKDATMPAAFAKVARHCPPFCVQPASIAQGVDTVGELEVLGYLKRIAKGDRTVMVVDSRSPEWIIRGTIPGSVNIPWNQINLEVEGSFEIAAEADTLAEVLQTQFGAQLVDGKWDFRNAKTLVLFCNGIWCPQSTANIKTLLGLGYPAYKLKWYRGGMQDWVSVGLTTVSE